MEELSKELQTVKLAASSVFFAIGKTKPRISELRNDAEVKRLIETKEAPETFIEETDTETTPSKRQRRVTSLV